MNKEVFDLSKFNVLSLGDYYYFFRALNNEDHNDIINGTTTQNNLITGVRTDLSRFTGKTSYTNQSEISLEEVHDHVKWAHTKDTNCISLTSNANVAETYGRENYHDEYVMVKVKKDEINNGVYIAGLYLMDEANKRVNEIISKYDQNSLEKYYFDAIDNVENRYQLNEVIKLIKRNLIDKNSNDISLTDTYDYLTLDESQNLEKDKLILKLDILNDRISNKFSNRLFIESLKFAFASSELIHYKEIPKEKVINVSKEVVDVFSLLQQMPNSDQQINEIKKFLIKNIENIDSISYPYENNKLNDRDFSIENMFKLTGGSIDYNTAMELYSKAYYFAKAKLRTYNTINMLNKILGNDPKYEKKLEFMKNNTYGIEPEISSRLNLSNMSLSESVTINFNESEKKLFELLNNMNEEELVNIVENRENYLVDKLNTFINQEYENITGNKPSQISENEYYVEAIVNGLDMNSIYTRTIKDKKLTKNEKYDICNALYKGNCKNLYNAFIQANVKKDLIPYYIVNLYLSKGFKGYNFEDLSNLPDLNEIIKKNIDNLNYKISALDFDALRNIKDDDNVIEGTNINLKDYQKETVDNINELFKDKNFAGVVLPTGAGKSYIAMTKMLDYRNSNIVYFSPNTGINRQIQRHIIRNIIGYNLDPEEVNKMIQDVNNYDNYIKQYFPYLKFYCYQGLTNKEEEELEKLDADLIIFDELHRTGADLWSKKINQLIKRNPNAKILGMSATPVRTDGEDMTITIAQLVGGYSSKDLLFGKHLAINMDLIQAIRDGIVISPKIVAFDFNLENTPQYLEIKEKYEKETDPVKKAEYKVIYDKLMQMISKSKLDGMKEIIEKNIVNKNGKYIVFLPRMSKERNNDYESYFNSKMLEMKNNLVNIDENPEQNFIYSGLSSRENDRIISEFESKLSEHMKLLYAIDMLDEGIHVDGISGSFMLKPISSSYIKFLQEFGRTVYAKEPGHIYTDAEIPVVFDLYNNYFCLNMDRKINKTNSEDDLERLIRVKSWIYKHGCYPDINSVNVNEASKAKILKKIKIKYEKYLDSKLLDNLDEKKKMMVEGILEIAQDLNLFDIDIPDRVIPPNEKDIDHVGTFELTAAQSELIDLVKKSRKVGGVRNQSPKIRAIMCMSVLDILDEYAIPINSDTLKLDMTLSDLKEILPQYAIDLIDDLGLDDDYQIGFEYNEIKKLLFHSRNIPIDGLNIETAIRYGLYDSFIENDETKSFVDNDFIVKGPSDFRRYNIKTGNMYDKDGYNIEGYDKHDFDRKFINKKTRTIVDEYGFNYLGINKKTGTIVDKHGFDINGIWYNLIDGKLISTESKYDERGFTIDGKAHDPITHELIYKNYSSEYDLEGYDIDGYDKRGFDRNHLHKDTETKYDRNGFDYLGKTRPLKRNSDGKIIRPIVNKYFFSSDGYYWVRTGNGKIKKTNRIYSDRGFDINGKHLDGNLWDDRGFDRDGFYWKEDKNGNRIKTEQKYDDGYFDVDGYYYEKKDGERIKTDRKKDENGFNCYHKYLHYMSSSGGFTERDYDDYGFDYKGYHKKTKAPYNERYFGRDGYYYAESEDGTRVKSEVKYNENGLDSVGYYWEKLENGTRKPTGSRYGDDGYNISGLDKHGFNKKKEYLNRDNVFYNNEGFDADGISKDTGEIYNNNYFVVNEDPEFYYKNGDFSDTSYTNIITGTNLDIRGFNVHGKTGYPEYYYRRGELQLFNPSIRYWNSVADGFHFDINGINTRTGTLYDEEGYNAFCVDENGNMKDGNKHPDIVFAEKYLEELDKGNNPLENSYIKDYIQTISDKLNNTIDNEKLVRIILFASSRMYLPLKSKIENIVINKNSYLNRKKDLLMKEKEILKSISDGIDKSDQRGLN